MLLHHLVAEDFVGIEEFSLELKEDGVLLTNVYWRGVLMFTVHRVRDNIGYALEYSEDGLTPIAGVWIDPDFYSNLMEEEKAEAEAEAEAARAELYSILMGEEEYFYDYGQVPELPSVDLIFENNTKTPDDSCGICLEGSVSDDVWHMTHCKHVFHVVCIAKWAKFKNTCPYCRGVLIEGA